MNVIDSLPETYRDMFISLLQERDRALYVELARREVPTYAQWEAVAEVFQDAFSDEIQSDGEPSQRGVMIDNALGAFFTRFPDNELTDAPAHGD